MVTTEEIIERIGGGGVIGIAVAAVAVANLPAVRRGARGLAKAAIVQYLRVTEPQAPAPLSAETERESGASPAPPARRARRARAVDAATEADEPVAAAPRPAARRAVTLAEGVTAAPARVPRRRSEESGLEVAPAEGETVASSMSGRQYGPSPAAEDLGAPVSNAAAFVDEPEEGDSEDAPARRPGRPRSTPEGGDGKLNLNTATRAELLRLPRVGVQTADRLISFRQEQGPITGLRQLRQADVISVAVWRQIREVVRF